MHDQASQTKRLMALAQAYIEGIAESPTGLVNGYLYALVAQPAGYNIDEHNWVVASLKKTGLVSETMNVLLWAGSDDKRQVVLDAIAARQQRKQEA